MLEVLIVIDQLNVLNERLDYAEGMLIGPTASERDSLARTDPMFLFPESPERSPIPLDVDALLEAPRPTPPHGGSGDAAT